MSEPISPSTPPLIDVLADASLSVGFAQGTGLGAVLLALVLIVFLVSRPFSRSSLVGLVRSLPWLNAAINRRSEK